MAEPTPTAERTARRALEILTHGWTPVERAELIRELASLLREVHRREGVSQSDVWDAIIRDPHAAWPEPDQEGRPR